MVFKHRSIVSAYSEKNEPKLLTVQEEVELLQHLKAIDACEEGESSKVGRAGYYKVLHRAIDSMKTLSENYVAESSDQIDHRRRAALYLCSELCAYWNNGLPYILSFSAGAPIPLISSEGIVLINTL